MKTFINYIYSTLKLEVVLFGKRVSVSVSVREHA